MLVSKQLKCHGVTLCEEHSVLFKISPLNGPGCLSMFTYVWVGYVTVMP